MTELSEPPVRIYARSPNFNLERVIDQVFSRLRPETARRLTPGERVWVAIRPKDSENLTYVQAEVTKPMHESDGHEKVSVRLADSNEQEECLHSQMARLSDPKRLQELIAQHPRLEGIRVDRPHKADLPPPCPCTR